MSVKIGFIILSAKSFEWPLLARLLPRLREIPDASITIHHDTFQSTINLDICKKYDVKVIPTVGRTSWASITNVFATITSFKALFQQKKQPEWYITLSPSCYPIKPSKYIINKLSTLSKDFYVDMRLVNFKKSQLLLDKYVEEAIFKKTLFYIPFISRYRKFYWRPIKLPRKDLPFGKDFHLFHGSDWFVLSQKAVAYLLESNLHNHPLVQFYLTKCPFENGLQKPSPQEIVIQSILGNEKSLNGEYRNWHYINWEGVVDWHPNILTEYHLPAIVSSDALWARKFDLEHSSTLIEQINKEILGIDHSC